jgi:hypothetical protein
MMQGCVRVVDYILDQLRQITTDLISQPKRYCQITDCHSMMVDTMIHSLSSQSLYPIPDTDSVSW